MLQVSKVQGATPIIAGNGDSWSAFETAFQHLFWARLDQLRPPMILARLSSELAAILREATVWCLFAYIGLLARSIRRLSISFRSFSALFTATRTSASAASRFCPPSALANRSAAAIRLHHLPLIADLLTLAPTVFCDLE